MGTRSILQDRLGKSKCFQFRVMSLKEISNFQGLSLEVTPHTTAVLLHHSLPQLSQLGKKGQASEPSPGMPLPSWPRLPWGTC